MKLIEFLQSSLDLGGSLMDEVMKAWTVSEPGQTTATNDPLMDDKSPLLEREPDFSVTRSSFDNIAMETVNGVEEGESSRGSTTPELSNSQEITVPVVTADSAVSEKKKKPKLKIVSSSGVFFFVNL